eukprot:791283-Pelagomonas_calceolata.AAC.1
MCARTLQGTMTRLNLLTFKPLIPTLNALQKTSNISGDAELISQIKEDALPDTEYAAVLTYAEEGQLPDFTEQDGLLWYTPNPYTQPCLYIPDGQVRTHLIQEAHDAPSGGHLGVQKTHESLHRYYYWPHMFRSVHQYVRNCMQCLRNKSTNQRPMGLLQPLPLPDHCWEQ